MIQEHNLINSAQNSGARNIFIYLPLQKISYHDPHLNVPSFLVSCKSVEYVLEFRIYDIQVCKK